MTAHAMVAARMGPAPVRPPVNAACLNPGNVTAATPLKAQLTTVLPSVKLPPFAKGVTWQGTPVVNPFASPSSPTGKAAAVPTVGAGVITRGAFDPHNFLPASMQKAGGTLAGLGCVGCPPPTLGRPPRTLDAFHFRTMRGFGGLSEDLEARAQMDFSGLGDAPGPIAQTSSESPEAFGDRISQNLRLSLLRAAAKQGLNPDALARLVLEVSTLGFSSLFSDALTSQGEIANDQLLRTLADQVLQHTTTRLAWAKAGIRDNGTKYTWALWTQGARDFLKQTQSLGDDAWNDSFIGSLPAEVGEAYQATKNEVTGALKVGLPVVGAGLGAYILIPVLAPFLLAILQRPTTVVVHSGGAVSGYGGRRRRRSRR